MKEKKLSQIKLKDSLELKENNMFIKFEYNEDNSITINKEFIIGMECRNIEDENNDIHELKFYLSSQQYPETIYFKDKKSLENVYNLIFDGLYQNNTLIIFDSKNGIIEPMRLK